MKNSRVFTCVAVLALTISLLTQSSAFAIAPEPASVGTRTLSADGLIIGGVPIRIRKIAGDWPQETVLFETESLGLVWRSVMTNTYEIAALDAHGAPIPSTVLEVFFAPGSHDNYVIITMPLTCPADLDGNGVVNVVDLADLLGNWGSCGGECVGDINSDRSVDSADLAILLGAWGSCVPTS